MIHIIDDYYVDGLPKDFTLLKKTKRLDKKGNIVYKVIGYYSCVANAVESLRKLKCRELTHEKNMELYEAIRAFKEVADELKEATKGLE